MTGQGVSATYDYDGHRRRVLITEPGAPRRVQFHNSAGLLLAEIGTNSANTGDSGACEASIPKDVKPVGLAGFRSMRSQSVLADSGLWEARVGGG